MKLRIWLVKRNLSHNDFAVLIGGSPSMVTKWLVGVNVPNAANLRLIYRATRGDVSPNDFFDLPKMSRRARLPTGLLGGAEEASP